ncbi:Helix-turn-helix domain protein [compost metagenome]
MNIRKSTLIALAKKDMRQADLAKKLGIASNTLSEIIGKETCSGQTLQKLADAFEMPVSEFIKLGED